MIVVHDALAAERGVDIDAVGVEADAVGGIAAVDKLSADVVEILKALEIVHRIDTGLGKHVLVVKDVAVAVALRIADLAAALILIRGQNGLPGVVKLLPGALLLHVDELLQRHAVICVGVHSDVLDRAVEHGGQLLLRYRSQLRVQLSRAALRLAGDMVLGLTGVEVVDDLLVLVAERFSEEGPDLDFDRSFGLGAPISRRILLLAARHKAQRHDEGKDKRKNLFHLCFSLFFFPFSIYKTPSGALYAGRENNGRI